MDWEQVKEAVDAIEAENFTSYKNGPKLWDDESAHAAQDGLMRQYIKSMATPETLAQFQRLWEMDFSRWYA